MEIIVNTGGINWCWYNWLTVDDEARTVTCTKAERFHRFDERQGANEHPKTDGWRLTVSRYSDTWPEDWKADWPKQLAKYNLPSDCRTFCWLGKPGEKQRIYQYID